MKKTILLLSFFALLALGSCSKGDDSKPEIQPVSEGKSLSPNVGGPTEPNQVYVSLSTGAMSEISRDSWDLGFYGGADKFRVILNSSVGMSAKQLNTTDIDAVQAEDATMIIKQGGGTTKEQVDYPDGDLSHTAIAEVSAIDSENKVYLINMGTHPMAPDPAPTLGAEGTSGDSRGWQKIRILRHGTDYEIQYENIDVPSHKTAVLYKNPAYNFTFFSFGGGIKLTVEPQKNQWDLNFTTFTYLGLTGPDGQPVTNPKPYRYSDFVATNRGGGVKAYKVTIAGAVTYDSFALKDVDNTKFTDDQSSIGGNWRSTVDTSKFPPVSKFTLFLDCFFVVKDVEGKIYKLKFTGGTLENKERGHPVFQYVQLK